MMRIDNLFKTFSLYTFVKKIRLITDFIHKNTEVHGDKVSFTLLSIRSTPPANLIRKNK